MSENSKKISIIGGGLAGSFLAAEMCRAGHQVTLFDRNDENAASRVAAGMFNIITGKVAAKTWLADELLAHLKAFLNEAPFGELAQYVHYTPIFRPFSSVFELNEWTSRQADPAFSQIIKVYPEPLWQDHIHNPLGGLMILPCGWVDTNTLIEKLKELLVRHFSLKWIKQPIDYASIHPKENKIELGASNHPFDHLFFCEGAWIKENPFFSWLDIRPLKGQIIEIQSNITDLDIMISKNGYAVPNGDGKWIVGSTYEKKFRSTNPDPEGAAKILDNLSQVLKGKFRILNSWAGVRATTPNRRPVLGKHPEHDNLHVFNGFGTKGVLQAPYFARHFVQHFDQKIDNLIHDASIDRFDN